MRRSYSIVSSFPVGDSDSANRADQANARFVAWEYVYNQFDAQGLRDRQAAHTAINLVQTFNPDRVPPNEYGQRTYVIPCGFQREVRITTHGGKPYKGSK